MLEQCVLVGELDGVRVINSRSQELLQEVPQVCQDIFKIASMAPGALLLEAHREYEVGTVSTFDTTTVRSRARRYGEKSYLDISRLNIDV